MESVGRCICSSVVFDDDVFGVWLVSSLQLIVQHMDAWSRLPVRFFSRVTHAPLPLSSFRISGSRTDKPPVLFLHGLFGNKNNWKSIARQVTAKCGRTTISFDLRNHGDSPHSDPESAVTLAMAADVREFVQNDQLSKCVLVGHSLGGRVALQFASLYPESLEKVVAVDVSPLRLPASMNVMSDYIDVMEDAVNQVHVDGGLAVARRAVDAHISSVIQEKLVRDFLIMNLVRDDAGKLVWKFNLRAFKELVTVGRMREVHFDPNKPCPCPSVFIYGQNSDFVHKKDIPAILKLFPNSKFHCIPDAGHYLHVEKQPEFINILTECL